MGALESVVIGRPRGIDFCSSITRPWSAVDPEA
jgi:hypothetical protein